MEQFFEHRQQYIERYSLSEPLVTALTPSSMVSLHYQRGTMAVCCIAGTPQSTAVGFVSESVGWTTYENQRHIYGYMPPTATSVEVTIEGRVIYSPHVISNVFLTIVSLPNAVTLTFKDAAGQKVGGHDLPLWQPIQPAMLNRLRWMIKQWGQATGLLKTPLGRTAIRIERKDKTEGL